MKKCRAHYSAPSMTAETEPSPSVTSFTIAPEETEVMCSDCDGDSAKSGAMLSSSAEDYQSEPWVRMTIGFMCVGLIVLAI